MFEYLSDIFRMSLLFFRAKGGIESRVAGLASVLSEALRKKEDVHLSGLLWWDRARSKAAAMNPGSVCVTSALCCCPQGRQREG